MGAKSDQLDPGIDHLYAVSTIEKVHKAGGKILSFLSYCGGLPAPEGRRVHMTYKTSDANFQTLETH